MVCIIGIGKVDKYLIIPIIGGIISNLINPIYNVPPLFIYYPFIFGLIPGISNFIAIIPFLISTFKSKKLFKTQEYIEKVKKKRLKKFLLIFIATLFSLSQSVLICFYFYGKIFHFWIIDIIIIYLFSYCILKARLHRHHYLSTIIIFISNIFLFIYQLNYNDSFMHILLDLIFEILLSIIYVINKYNMEYLFCSPYELIFYSGLIYVIIYGIAWFIFSLIDSQYFFYGHLEYFKQFDLKELFLVLAYMILNFLYNVCILLTNKHYDPFYILILLIVVEISKNIIMFDLYLYLPYINNLILLFSILVFNEIIELNCFGLSNKTKKNMEKKADLEALIEEKNNNERTSNCSGDKIDIDNYHVELENVPVNNEEEEELEKH